MQVQIGLANGQYFLQSGSEALELGSLAGVVFETHRTLGLHRWACT